MCLENWKCVSGSAVGRYLDRKSFANIELIDDLESLGLLVLDQIESMAARRREEEEEARKLEEDLLKLDNE